MQRSRRTAAIKAQELIKNILKEEEEDIEMVDNTKINKNLSMSKHIPVIKEHKSDKVTSDTTVTHDANYHWVAKSQIAKRVDIVNIKYYLEASDNNDMRYIAMPELLKYLISHPYIITTNPNFATTVIEKMKSFMNELNTKNNIGNYKFTDKYRRELNQLCSMTLNIAEIYSTLDMSNTFYANLEANDRKLKAAIAAFKNA